MIAIVFFATSFALAYFAKERSDSVADLGIPEQAQEAMIPSDELDLPELAIPEVDDDSEVPQL